MLLVIGLALEHTTGIAVILQYYALFFLVALALRRVEGACDPVEDAKHIAEVTVMVLRSDRVMNLVVCGAKDQTPPKASPGNPHM